MADRDGNGKLTREELEGFFRAADSGGEGFLSLADLQEALTPPSRGRRSSSGSQGPSRLTLVKGLFRQEIGSLQPGPALDAAAPDFTLKTVDGKEEITLSKLVGPKPVVLVFGNFTCGPFRSQAGNVEKLYQPLPGPCHVRDGLCPRGPSDRRLAAGEQRPGRGLDPPAAKLRRARQGCPDVQQAARAWGCRCWLTRSATRSAPATAGCPAGCT